MNGALMFSKASDEWATPWSMFDELHAEFHFALDAAATRENTKCIRHLGSDGAGVFSDALIANWWSLVADGWTLRTNSAVWLNPPYSKCREFIAKAASEAQKGCTVVCLVPSRTDTKWWHEHVWDGEKHQPRAGVEVRFLKGRVKFGGAKHGAPFPSVVIIFRGAR
jgi:phage N-6-adenine-methyltransferase